MAPLSATPQGQRCASGCLFRQFGRRTFLLNILSFLNLNKIKLTLIVAEARIILARANVDQVDDMLVLLPLNQVARQLLQVVPLAH